MLRALPSLPSPARSSRESGASPRPHPRPQPGLSPSHPGAPAQANPGGRDVSCWGQTATGCGLVPSPLIFLGSRKGEFKGVGKRKKIRN